MVSVMLISVLLSLGFQALYICSRSANALYPAVDGRTDMRSVRVMSREPGTVRGTERRSHFSLAIISVTVQLRI